MSADPMCVVCNYDGHICPGCGTPTTHGHHVCDECAERIRREDAAGSDPPITPTPSRSESQ